MQAVSPEVRLMFNQVERVLRLLLVMPASSCSAERSFRALRRLKTWLRNSMTQNRLNAVAVCHVHQHYLDDLDLGYKKSQQNLLADLKLGVAYLDKNNILVLVLFYE